MSVSAMDKIMSPASMAVIGASSREHTIGFDIMKNLQKYGYSGTIYPINPKDSEIQGLKAYPSVLDVPGPIDMAVIVINSKFVLSTIDQCHQKASRAL